MVVIPEPAEGTRTVLRSTAPAHPLMGYAPYFGGDGPIDYTCGGCSLVLARGLTHASQIADFVLVCMSCAAYNETRT